MILTTDHAWDVFENLKPMAQIACAVCCAKTVCKDTAWNIWADSWLEAKDRTQASAKNAFEDITPRMCTKADQAAQMAALAARHCDLRASDNGVAVSVRYAQQVSSNVLEHVLLLYFLCPYCHLTSEQHTSNGHCLFGAHVWKDIYC